MFTRQLASMVNEIRGQGAFEPIFRLVLRFAALACWSWLVLPAATARAGLVVASDSPDNIFA
ncbi:MAG TPA: hypothetical protein VNH11_11920 [Pirellulales bacterium]|nr:hypothetical protein [Pirellulales bacterium]